MTLSEKSLARLRGVHADLVKVVMAAAASSILDFTVLEGLRSLERQKMLLAAGKSTTMRSRHLTGHAVDLGVLLNGTVSWDWALYEQLADEVKRAAAELKIPIEWGGDWKSFKDGVHFQLPFNTYPEEKTA